MSRAKRVFLQNDAAPDGSEAKNFTWWDPQDKSRTEFGSVKEFAAGCEVAGKKSQEVAAAIDFTLTNTFAQPDLQFFWPRR